MKPVLSDPSIPLPSQGDKGEKGQPGPKVSVFNFFCPDPNAE